jgi:hypothetical protein
VRRIGWLLFGVAICVRASEQLATPAPGSAFSALDRAHYECQEAAAETLCHSKVVLPAFEGLKVRGRLLRYVDGRLAQASELFAERDFGALLEVLQTRLGQGVPAHEKLQAGMAGVFDNRIFVWQFSDHVVMLEQYFERITQSAVSTMPRPAFEALMLAREQRRLHGAREL